MHEISSSKQPHLRYIELFNCDCETWWWQLKAETCSFNCYTYIRIPKQLCHWLITPFSSYTHTTGMIHLKVALKARLYAYSNLNTVSVTYFTHSTHDVPLTIKNLNFTSYRNVTKIALQENAIFQTKILIPFVNVTEIKSHSLKTWSCNY